MHRNDNMAQMIRVSQSDRKEQWRAICDGTTVRKASTQNCVSHRNLFFIVCENAFNFLKCYTVQFSTLKACSHRPLHCESEPIKSKYKQRRCIKQDPDWLLVTPKNVLIFAYISTMWLIDSSEKTSKKKNCLKNTKI